MTTFTSFSDAVNSASVMALNNYVLPSICNWLQTNKNLSVTPLELAGALSIAAPPKYINVGTINPPMGAIPGTGGRKKAKTGEPQVVPEGEGCIRIPKTGPKDKRGVPCNKPKLPGKEFCKACNRLKSGGNEGGTPVATKPETGLVTQPIDNTPDVQINADDKKIPGYYVETTCKLIFKIINDTYIFYAKLSDDETKILRVSESDKIYANGLQMKQANKVEEDKEFETLCNLRNPVAVPIINPGFGITQLNGAMPNIGVYNPNVPNAFNINQPMFAPITNTMFG